MDEFDQHAKSLTGPATRSYTIVPHANDLLERIPRGIIAAADCVVTGLLVGDDPTDAVRSFPMSGRNEHALRFARITAVAPAGTALLGLE